MSTQKEPSKANVIWATFIVVVLSIIIGNAFLAVNTIQGLSQTQNSLDNTSMLTSAIEKLHLSVVQAESGQRGYLLTEKSDYLVPYYDALEQLESQTEHVKSLSSEINGQAERIALLLSLVDQKEIELKKTVNLAQNNKERSALYLVNTDKGRELYKKIRLAVNEIQDREMLFKVSHFSKLAKIKNEAKITFVITAVTSGLLIIGMFVLTRLNLECCAVSCRA